MKLFEEQSIVFQKNLSKKERADGGVFFTPKDVRDIVFEELGDFVPSNVLEPTCGSGEFIVDCERLWPLASVTGVELDPRSAEIARTISKSEIIVHDFMTWSCDKKFDLIIGNPPYFTRPTGFKHDKNIVKCRSNICIEVMYKCITQHMTDDGIIALVLPVSILNSKFYTPTLDLITSTMDVVSARVIETNNFMGTNVKVMSFVLRKRTKSFTSKYVFNTLSGRIIINPNGDRLYSLANGRKTIGTLDVDVSFGVTSGSVKEFFTNKDETSFPLICHNDIVKKYEPQYISSDYTKKRFSGRAILIPRGYPHGKYSFGFLDYKNKDFIIENHVIALTGNDDVLDIISKSFSDTRTSEFCRLLCSSGDITKDYVKEIPLF
ncbi:DNA adenine methyltransferase [Only Syngen Nebraska virus 5]|uniref:DNA adenine methyltransferase n=1 Tax=Only Syngen Nebraska virus 5 TaxID=1917232 RepID=UPI00090189BB|nr:DNA adenine methyltransferase [Only Syngen Nebraska virus 5]APC25639.1 DNA adenine methyltransferase [Only Syngen Nebraska virus 5]